MTHQYFKDPHETYLETLKHYNLVRASSGKSAVEPELGLTADEYMARCDLMLQEMIFLRNQAKRKS